VSRDVTLAAGGDEDGAGAPSGWRRARERERDREKEREREREREREGWLGFGNLPAPLGKLETIDMFLPD
jgi:hypothetical protein